MKKSLSAGLIVLFILCLLSAAAAADGAPYTEKAVPVISNGETSGELSLRFYDDAPHVPYMGLNAYSQYMKHQPLTLLEQEDGTLIMENGTGEELFCDVDAGTISVPDWDRFFDLPLPLENEALGWKDTATRFARITAVDFEGDPEPVLLDFAKYGIKKSRLQEETGTSNGTFGRAIQDLVDCGYIIEYKKKYEEYNPLYVQLMDPYLLFHYHYLSKEKRVDSYEDMVSDMGRYDNWRGQAFEILCFNNTDAIKSALGISGVKTESYPWYNSEDDKNERVQIDMVIERADNITNLCEMKYSNKPFEVDASYEQQLLRKRDIFRKKTGTSQALKIILVSAKGLSGVAYTSYISVVITLDDLFEG